MKLKVKFSSTQKFILRLEEPTLGKLKDEIRKFVDNTYNEAVREPLTLSLNGSDPIVGNDDASLQSTGIVAGDMVIIIPPVTTASQMEPPAAAVQNQGMMSSHVNQQSTAAKEEKQNVSGASGAFAKEERQKVSDTGGASAKKERQKVSDTGGASSAGASQSQPVQGPLLEARDGQPPVHLNDLFSEYVPSTPSQAVNLLVHLIICECGFYAENSDGRPPGGWKEMVATFKYRHSSFPDFQCTLVLVTMGEVKQVLASFPQQESEISVRVVINEYIKDSSAPMTAGNLTRVAQLARTLRDRLLHPLQVAAHQALGVPAPWQLVGLPQEILLVIGGFLSARSLLSLGESCRRLHSAMDDNKLWEKLYKKDFKNLYEDIDKSGYVDWKTKYKEAVIRLKEWKKLMDEGMEYVIPGHQPPYPFPIHPHPPHPDFPLPRGPNPYPPQPHPTPNPFYDPDSPYFGGEVPPIPGAFPDIGDPFGPLGIGPRRPRPNMPFQPPFMPRPRTPRGPRFDFF